MNASVVDKAFVKRLTRGTPDQRREAERTLDELGQSGLEALLRFIEREEKKREIRMVILGGLLLTSIAGSLVSSLWAWHATGHFPHDLSFLSELGIFSAITWFSATHKGAALVLARYDDVRAVGPFATCLHSDGELRKAAEAGLIRLLPRVQASDAHYLDENQRAALNKQLDSKYANIELVKVILLAWQQVGDEKAIPHVESLSRNEKRTPEIRQAAADCLPYLQQSAANLRSSELLLRASDGGAARPDELLRAATTEAAACPAELLRASAAEAASPNVKIYQTVEEQPYVDARPV